MRKVYVLEMDVISPLGIGIEKHMEGVRAGKSGSAPLTSFDGNSFPTSFGCEVKEDLSYLYPLINRDLVETFPYDRKEELFCCSTALLAPKISSFLEQIPGNRLGVFMGAGLETIAVEYLAGCTLDKDQENFNRFRRENRTLNAVHRFLNPSHLGTLYAASLFGATGPRHTNLSACAASAQAVGNGFLAIQRGQCDVAIVGGYDSTIHLFIYAAFSQLHMISTRNESPSTASRPFDVHRDGFVPGEGAGVLVLASEEIAQKWGSPICEISGYGSSLDGYKVTAPHESGLGAELAMRRALKSAKWSPEEIEYINAHGTSTPLNDAVETMALQKIFGEYLPKIPVSSTKSQIGHLIAAGGIVECITVAAAMNKGFMPPSINISRQDPACPLSLVSLESCSRPFTKALSNSFALAGQNATLAIASV